MRKNQKIGISILLVPIAALIAVAIFQKMSKGPSYDLYVTFREAGALKAGDDVAIEGVKAGKVRGLTLMGDSLVLVKVELPENIRIPKGSQFQLMSVDSLGEKAIGVTRAPSREYYSGNDTVAGAGTRASAAGPAGSDSTNRLLVSDKLDSIIILLHNQNRLLEQILKFH